MTDCESCAGKGLIRLNWADADDEYALCLCPAGQAWRKSENNGKATNAAWHVWCAREQVNPECVWCIEDVLTAEELAQRGFGKAVAAAESREAALLKAISELESRLGERGYRVRASGPWPAYRFGSVS